MAVNLLVFYTFTAEECICNCHGAYYDNRVGEYVCTFGIHVHKKKGIKSILYYEPGSWGALSPVV